MFGTGILKGLGVTLKRTVATFVDDLARVPSRYTSVLETSQGKILRQPTDSRGIFTIQYPEERRQLPERFRYIPMLVYEEDTGEDRCTACGICAKVCPPQCIWIVRDQDEKGKPITRPAEFYIDASICMSCGFCAEYCPFDAIKMNHDYELATYDRFPGLIFNLQELSVPTSYYAALYPKEWEAGAEARAKKAARAKRSARKKAPAGKATAAEKPAAQAVAEKKKEAAPAPKPAPEPAPAPKAEPRAKHAGGHWSPIPEGYSGPLIESELPLPPVPAEGTSPSGVPWSRIMKLREQQLLRYRQRRKAEGKEVKL
ncbi:MAG: 4Fe-4S dicluster domain-containing protein [Caldilineae bacterium]|nr:MAG: 4Fe-4S dicluster domain-containing protein [Caldilineae bacterium]